MADPNTCEEEGKVSIAEFSVSMHCNACERSVAKAISKIKGVEKFMTDMPNHRVVVRGQIKPEKVVKKIKKKTGKRVEIIDSKEDKEDDSEEENLPTEEAPEYVIENFGFGHCCLDTELYTMFSDENPNACSII